MKQYLITFFKKWLFDVLIVKILGSAAGGIKLFVVKYLIGKLWQQILYPILTKVIRYVQTYLRERELRKIAKRTKEATNAKEYKSAIDDMFK